MSAGKVSDGPEREQRPVGRRHQRLRESPEMLDPIVPDPDGLGSQIGVTEREQAGFVNSLRGARNWGDWESLQYASPRSALAPSVMALVTPKLRNSSPRNG